MKPLSSRLVTAATLLAVSASALSLQLLSAPAAWAIAAVANPDGAAAQESAGFGPLDPAQPTGLTSQQIIEKFAARETLFSLARQNYTFRQTVKVDTLAEDTNRVDGEYQQVTDITFDKDGKRAEHVVFAPQNSLERVLMTPADFDEIEHRLPFILTTEDLPKYDITYLGRQHIDELDTYVFSAAPKTFEKGKRYFQGKVWVDQQDLQIVLVNGITVPQDKRKGHEDLSPPFTTYYEQVDGKYWFPTYTKAEGNLHFVAQEGALSQDVHMRNVVKYTDYKQYHATARIIYNGEDITDKKAPEDKSAPPQPVKPPN
ncbi:hypothetical protein [Granulicella sp. S190]|uniref:hypothetical protein n=1 Tax=Granulicella sp. S190 TaxID=1747226 RepID=UPI00131C8DFF|nr:hypothetical protein [Granulicella sp. S190]